MLTFKADYRNRIRKAPKKGVEVKIMGNEALDDFVRIMQETGDRDGFQQDRKHTLNRFSTAWVRMQDYIWLTITDRL